MCRDRARLGQTGHRVAGLCVSRAADKGGAEAEVVGIDGLVDRAVLDAGLRKDHLLASVDQVVRLDGEGGGGLTEVVCTVSLRAGLICEVSVHVSLGMGGKCRKGGTPHQHSLLVDFIRQCDHAHGGARSAQPCINAVGRAESGCGEDERKHRKRRGKLRRQGGAELAPPPRPSPWCLHHRRARVATLAAPMDRKWRCLVAPRGSQDCAGGAASHP